MAVQAAELKREVAVRQRVEQTLAQQIEDTGHERLGRRCAPVSTISTTSATFSTISTIMVWLGV